MTAAPTLDWYEESKTNKINDIWWGAGSPTYTCVGAPVGAMSYTGANLATLMSQNK